MKTHSTLIVSLIGILALLTSVGFVAYQIASVDEATATTATGTTLDRSIVDLENQVEKEPKNTPVALGLSAAYLQKVRETGDISYYEKILKLLDTAEVHAQDTAVILATRAEVENGRHDFAAGLEYSKQAIKKNPEVSAFYGIKSDSELELGNYDEALHSLQNMIDRKPNFSSFARVAYQRELHGDRAGALEALETAISAGSAHAENIAWAYTEMGKLRIKSNPEIAKQDFKRALELYPNFAPALEGLGRIAWKEEENDEAERYYTQAFDVLPLAQYALALGNFYGTQGDVVKADQYYVLADLAYKNSGGVNIDLEYALFLAEHGDVSEALTRAQAAYSAHPSIYAADAMAWALYKNNRVPDARKYITEALRLGEHDPMILFHAGEIAESAGETEKSRAYFKKALALDQYAATNYSKSLADIQF